MDFKKELEKLRDECDLAINLYHSIYKKYLSLSPREESLKQIQLGVEKGNIAKVDAQIDILKLEISKLESQKQLTQNQERK